MSTFKFEEDFATPNSINSKVNNTEESELMNLDTSSQEEEEQEEEEFEKCLEEDFSILFEIINDEKFRNLDTLNQEDFEKCNEVEEYINSVFNNAIKVENWEYKSYDIVICPKCSRTRAYYFHGLNTFSSIEIIALNCAICGFTINEHNKVIQSRKGERGPKLTGTKIPFYSGILIKNNILE